MQNDPPIKLSLSTFFNARVLSILFLGFSSGLPLALCGATLQAWYAVSGISIVTIGLLSLVGQPYVYKFIWAPLMDRYVPPLLGRRRGWILLLQLGLVIGIGAMAFFNPKSTPLGLAILAFIVAFLSASQDIAINAYNTDILQTNERGIGAAYMMNGYRIAMIVSGGLALIMADHYGWRFTYLFMAGLLLCNTLATIFGPEIEPTNIPSSLRSAVIDPWREFISRPNALLILIFLILYKFGDAFTVSLSSAFLLQYLHFSLSTVGFINKIIGIFATVIGGLTGGILLTRINLFRALWWFGLAQASCSFLYFALSLIGKNIALLVITIGAENIFGGMSEAAFLAFVISLCNKRYTATQFALFSAITAIGRVFVGPLAGITAQNFGWPHYFFIAFFISVPGLWLLWHLRSRYDAQPVQSY